MKKSSILFILLSFFGLCSTNTFGQLSGTYTINTASPTAGTNYQTFSAAVSALTTSGISAPVTFNVMAGTYTEQITIPAITGASSTNTITIKGLNDLTILSSSPTTANLPVMSLVSTSHLIIENLKIEVLGAQGFAVHFMNNADSIVIRDCHIVTPPVADCYGIIASGSISALSNAGIDAEYLTIEGNLIEGGKSSIFIRGATTPLTTPSKKANYGNGFIIEGNTMLDFTGNGVDLSYNSNISFLNNELSSSQSTANGALRIWDAGDAINIDANKFYLASNVANTRLVSLAMAPANGPAGEVLEPIVFSNNFVHYDGTHITAPTGLLIKNKAYVKVYHNTFRTRNQGAKANCIWLDANNNRDLDGIEIRNNVMYLDNSGSGQFIYNAAKGDKFKNMIVDHNDYYCENGYFKLVIPNGTAGTTTFSNFTNYTTNSIGYGQGALNVDPVFVSGTDLHISAVALNDSGAVISSITTDIDGEIRSLTNPDMGADEFSPPQCLPSTAVGTFNTLATTTNLFWTQSNPGSSIKLEYGISGFTLGTGIKLSPTNDTIVLGSLIPQTTYDVYIKELCSPTDSSTWTSYSFTTACGIVANFPYSEGFESSNWTGGTGNFNTGFVIDPCWTSNPTNSTMYRWGTRSGLTGSTSTGPAGGFGGTGNYVFTEASRGINGSNANFTTPAFDFSPLSIPQITFRYHMSGIDMGTLMLWAWNGVAYDTVMMVSGDQGSLWNEAIIDLSNYTNDTLHFVFHAVRGSGLSSDIAIDSIVIQEAPPCPKPTVVTIDSISTSSVRINFASGGHKFPIEFGPTGFNQGTGTTDTALGTGYTVNGLTPNTSYDFYISSDCSDSANGNSVWVGPFTIHTQCSFVNSYFTDWDYLANNETDYCWTFLKYGAIAAYARAYDPSASIALQPFSGNNYYRVYNSSQAINYLISPELTELDSNKLQIRFQAADTYTGSNGTPAFYVGTMLSVGDTGSFTPLDTVFTITNAWTEYVVLLNAVPLGNKHVVIRHSNNANTVYMGIDDLYIEPQPACNPPSLATTSDLQDTSVVISWTAGDGSSWEIEYGTVGFSQGSGILISGLSTTTDTIGGLLAETCYEFYVRGICPNNNSPWIGPITVCTDCATINAPYMENFDGAGWVPGSNTINQIAGCWNRTPNSTSAYRWQTNSGATTSSFTGPDMDVSGTGNYVYTEATNGSNNNETELIMPRLNFSSLSAPTLNFSYHMYGASMGEMMVLISNGNQFDTIWSISGQQQNGNSAAWKNALVDLSLYGTQPRVLKFVGTRGTSYTGDMAIDEISVDEFPTCLSPANFNLDSVSTFFADFSWSSLSNGTAFKMEFGPAGFSQGSNTLGVAYSSTSPTRVNGLLPNRTYDIYLTDLCDSTIWIGPITFTTLINEDAEVLNLVSPSNLVCGDSNYVVEILVKNNGLNSITNLPVGANISGALSANINSTYTGNIAPGATMIVPVGVINSYNGGLINIQAYTALTGDQELANDTLSTSGIDIISVVPVILPVDTLCINDTTGQFISRSQAGVTSNWYYNATDTVPFSMKDTVSVLGNQTLFLDRSKEVDQMIIDINGFSNFGNMVKLYIKKDFTFTGFSFEPATNGTAEPIAFYKQGGFKGFETNKSAWTAIDSATITGGSSNTWMKLTFNNPVHFQAGDTISLYLANKLSTKMETVILTQVNAIGDLFLQNDDFEYYAGVSGAYFGSNMTNITTPRAVSSIIHYNSNEVCGNNRISLTMPVNTDTAFADFNINGTGAWGIVNFDAGASIGHIYSWDFGNGSTGTGENTSGNYSVSGSYRVRLTVTDTVCGTMDTISKIAIVTVSSLGEQFLNNNLEVYPNPNNGKFNLKLNLIGAHEIKVSLLNSMGQLVYKEDLGIMKGDSSKELNIENISRGVYQLQVLADGKSTTIKVTIL